jgi:hypothetical protein
MWLTSHDEDFRAKRDDVLLVDYDAPSGEHIVSLDEKTGMQALERVHPDIPMRPGEPVRRKPTYIRPVSVAGAAAAARPFEERIVERNFRSSLSSELRTPPQSLAGHASAGHREA